LPNRVIFERRAQRALDRTATALLYVDIDKLAAINEAFGLSAGDEVIQRIGNQIQRAAAADALVSRIGGDRFAVALAGRDLAEARALGATILDATRQLGYLHDGEALPVSVSIGAVIGAQAERLAHALAAAELACKRAKAEGGGRSAAIETSANLTPAAARQELAATELSAALQSNQFQLDAQPIVGLRSSDAVGFELLVRLRNSAGDLLAPNKFLEACEQYGLTPALDRWVLCAAIEALRPHARTLAGSRLFFTVNVSAQSLESRKYAAFALEALAAAGLPPTLFCFELKESAAVGHLVAADALIRELTNAGAKVALDDFGSGLSSLAHLKQLPVSYLKIDGQFVRRMIGDRVAESIVSGIARAAQTLGIVTIAEHVESAAVVERLRELDVALGQGFHLGRPQPLNQAVQQAIRQAAAGLPSLEAATGA
jgi:diguanylate cyclase (GGDEF)-like protein